MRSIVLNADYAFLSITKNSYEAVKLLAKGRATPLALYERKLRSEREEFEVPAVSILRSFVNVGRRRHGFSQASHQNVFVRDKEKCAYCGTKLTLRSCTKDHVIPRSKGGLDVLSNVVACCRHCNARKADMTVSESGLKLRDDIELRPLTEDEKLSVLLKTGAGAIERKAWIGFLKDTGLTLF